MKIHRAALYYAPAPGSPWHAFGSAWLGRDAVSGAGVAQPAVPGLAGTDLHSLTTHPRRYGFHATLKAPFRLAPTQSLETLKQAIEDFAAQQAPVALGSLTPQWMEGYVALLPALEARAGIATLAAQLVQTFEAFRAPLSAEELAKRRPERLTPRQQALLAHYGYPYVLEEFRLHLTLSDAVDAAQADVLIRAAAARIESLQLPAPKLDAVTLFVEPAPGAPFIAVRRYALRGPSDHAQAAPRHPPARMARHG